MCSTSQLCDTAVVIDHIFSGCYRDTCVCVCMCVHWPAIELKLGGNCSVSALQQLQPLMQTQTEPVPDPEACPVTHSSFPANLPFQSSLYFFQTIIQWLLSLRLPQPVTVSVALALCFTSLASYCHLFVLFGLWLSLGHHLFLKVFLIFFIKCIVILYYHISFEQQYLACRHITDGEIYGSKVSAHQIWCMFFVFLYTCIILWN